MNLKTTESLLKLLKQYGVSHFKNVEVEVYLNDNKPEVIHQQLEATPKTKGPPTAAAAPPVKMEIPHHVNEVANLLKLSDEYLVDKLFPEYPPKDE